MARNQRTPEQFEAIADQLLASSNTLREVATSMREGGMPDALVHATLPENTHIPALVDWIDKLKIDVRSQLRSYLAGVQSPAELHKHKSDNQKRASGKKPAKKKTP